MPFIHKRETQSVVWPKKVFKDKIYRRGGDKTEDNCRDKVTHALGSPASIVRK